MRKAACIIETSSTRVSRTALLRGGLMFAFGALLWSVPSSAEAAFSKATKHGRASGCPRGSFFDPRNSGECWQCPAGTKRTVFPVTGAQACERAGRSSFGKASFRRKAGCPRGSFFDPRKGGECWQCPSHRPRRTAYPVTDRRACASKNVFGEKLSKANFKGKPGCPSGSFFDPRNRGECWQCPSGTKRTVFPVTGGKACERRTQAVRSRATFKQTFLCPSGQFWDVGTGACWSCPRGTYRTVNKVTGRKACTDRPAEMFAIDTDAFCKGLVRAMREGERGAKKIGELVEPPLTTLEKPLDDALKDLTKDLKSPRELDRLLGQLASAFDRTPIAPILAEQARLKRSLSGAERLLLDPQLMCRGNARAIEGALRSLGVQPVVQKVAEAAGGGGKRPFVAYSAAVSFITPKGLGVSVGYVLLSDFAGNGGMYITFGPLVSTAKGVSGGVGVMVFPAHQLGDFEGAVPGADLSLAAAGAQIDKLFKKVRSPKLKKAFANGVPDGLDLTLDVTFQSFPGVGISRGFGGKSGMKVVDLTGAVAWSLPIRKWGR